MIRNQGLLALLFTISALSSFAQPWKSDPKAQAWSDSVVSTLSLEEKVGQLFMVAAYSNKPDSHKQQIEKYISNYHIGGLLFFQGGPVRQARLTNYYQQKSKIPLLISMDAEWGLDMRLDSCFRYPWAMTLGAVQDLKLLEKVGEELGEQCKRLGVHWNFAPVLDLNTNSANPIINARSFGEDVNRVLPAAMALALGMQSKGVLPCGKHFPGHGDTDKDSHKTLPIINKSLSQLEKIELEPFKRAIQQDLASIMVAHLNVPSLTGSNEPTSLSSEVVTELLRNEMQFNGLIVTDGLNMAGAMVGSAGDVELQAFLAGNDVLLFPPNVEAGYAKIIEHIRTFPEVEKQLNESIQRILIAKYWVGLNKYKPIELKNLHKDLNKPSYEITVNKLAESAITLLVNRDNTLPFKTDSKSTACVIMGAQPGVEFTNQLKKFTDLDVFVLKDEDESDLLYNLSTYDRVIVGWYTSGISPWKSYNPENSERNFLDRLSLQSSFVLSLFGNPYAIKTFPEVLKGNALIQAYQNHPAFERKSAELIFGVYGAEGRLPVKANWQLPAGAGIRTDKMEVMGHGKPEEVGMNSTTLNTIDDLVDEAIKNGTMPGAQILIARRGKVIFQKNYGFHTYEKESKVTDYDLYDIASITKIVASTLAIMSLYDTDDIDIDKTLGYYIPAAKNSNKSNVVIREMLAHQAGLQAWIPFYMKTLDKNGSPKKTIYSSSFDAVYSTQVAENMFIRRDYSDTIIGLILKSNILKRKEYKYSDLGYYLMQYIIEKRTKMSLNEYVSSNFYEPMGLTRLTYNPLNTFSKKEIIPTENDTYFRKQLIHGYVHDQGAAMLGGVGGHAGIFANSLDLAKLMQMFLNGGTYGGKRYLSNSTLKEFTDCQYCEEENRRGVGFDKPQLSGEGPACACVSMLSYGHTGFTGTMAWVDPQSELIYIFLSNRVNPDAQNTLLIRSSLRTNIQEIIYNSIEE